MNFSDQFPANISRALKKKFDNIMVGSTNNPTHEVPVTFVEPDFELRNAEYPGIYLAYGPITKADDREHRGPTNLTYAPPNMPVNVQVPKDMYDKDSAVTEAWSQTFDRYSSPYRVADTPIPYNVDFNIMLAARNYQQNFQMIEQLQRLGRLPTRFGFLEIPEDGTVRTLEVLGGPTTNAVRDEDGKRLIQTLYTVRVAAELSLYEVQQVNRVHEVDIEGPWL